MKYFFSLFQGLFFSSLLSLYPFAIFSVTCPCPTCPNCPTCPTCPSTVVYLGSIAVEVTLVSGPDVSVSLYTTNGSIATAILSAGNSTTLSFGSSTFPQGECEIIATPINATTGSAVLDYVVHLDNGVSYSFPGVTVTVGTSSFTGFHVP
ncbi:MULTISPECIES: hypothetical protein [Parachlamydia]|uniref:Uncharacterized protein n=1 Tax=Parachlamydia acanthamoebae TaxID=83552 RepID=A0A0C1C7X2_9BACT|nr:hypothetical protein [Parachlamydia acanthamoebae]KIA77120.1 hypothetical protein DB43_GU00130 [Parachlamydia acanthamoebae]